MKKVSIKIPAKINLTLDVLGVTDGFHDIKSLVASIDVYDIRQGSCLWKNLILAEQI